MSESKKKDYSVFDLVNQLKDVVDAAKKGNLAPYTTFGAPMDVAQYDSLTATSHAMQQRIVAPYSQGMSQTPTFRRQRTLGLYFGQDGKNIIQQLTSLSPAIGESIMGLHGLSDATRIIGGNANAMSAAFNIPTGGLLDPRQLAERTTFAARLGAATFKNNFNKDGTINVDQTKGLSLTQSALIQNRLLADKSQYDNWADIQKTTNADGLSDAEIEGLRRGTGLTAKSVESFSKHMTKVQEEMNKYVSSISKMTGSVEGAVEFLQRMTNGKAFSAGQQADQLRQRAAKIANNMRVSAAEAGINPNELYNIAFNKENGFATLYNRAQGKSSYTARWGDQTQSTEIAALSSVAFADWLKTNPDATHEEKERMQGAIQQRVINFSQGDSSKYTALLSKWVDTESKKDPSKKNEIMAKAQELVNSGDLDAVRKFMVDEKYYLDEGAFDEALNDDELVLDARTRHNATYTNLAKRYFTTGFTQEDKRVSTENRLNLAQKNLVYRFGATLKDSNIEAKLEDQKTAAFKSKEALLAAGYSDEEADELIERANNQGWDAEDISSQISADGKNAAAYQRAAIKTFRQNIQKNLIDTISDEKIRNRAQWDLNDQFDEFTKDTIGGEVTEQDIQRAATDKVVRDKQGKIASVRHQYNEAQKNKDEKAREAAMGSLLDLKEEALQGTGEFEIRDRGFATKLAENAIKASGIKDPNGVILAKAQAVFNEEIGKNVPVDVALGKMRDTLRAHQVEEAHLGFAYSKEEYDEVLSGSEKGKSIQERAVAERKNALTAVIAQTMGDAAVKGFLNENGVTNEEVRSRVETNLIKNIRDQMDSSAFKNGKMSLEDAVTEALAETITSESTIEGSALRGMTRKDVESFVTSKEGKALIDKAQAGYLFSHIDVSRRSATREATERRKKGETGYSDSELKNEAYNAKTRTSYAGDRSNENSVTIAEVADQVGVDRHLESAIELDKNPLVDQMIELSDREGAAAMGKTHGRFTQREFDKAKRKLKIDSKKDVFQGFFGNNDTLNIYKVIDQDTLLRDRVKGIDGDEGFTEQDIKLGFESFLNKYADADDTQFKDDFTRIFSGDVVSALTSQDGDENPLSLREAVSAYVSGVGAKNEDERVEKMGAAYTETALLKNPNLVEEEGASQQVFQKILAVLDEIRENTGDTSRNTKNP